jgi:hypothetical protein
MLHVWAMHITCQKADVMPLQLEKKIELSQSGQDSQLNTCTHKILKR